jgi:hypothetical protein
MSTRQRINGKQPPHKKTYTKQETLHEFARMLRPHMEKWMTVGARLKTYGSKWPFDKEDGAKCTSIAVSCFVCLYICLSNSGLFSWLRLASKWRAQMRMSLPLVVFVAWRRWFGSLVMIHCEFFSCFILARLLSARSTRAILPTVSLLLRESRQRRWLFSTTFAWICGERLLRR